MRWPRLVVAAALAAVSCGCAGSGDTEVRAVAVTDGGYDDPTIVVEPGTEVRWENQGSAGHTVTSGDDPLEPRRVDWDSGRLRPGETFSRRFEEPGTYLYWCSYHADQEMLGTITVEAP